MFFNWLSAVQAREERRCPWLVAKYAGLVALLVLVVASCAGCSTSRNMAEDWTVPTEDPPALFPVRQDGKWGYIDKSGALVIDSVFDAAHVFSEGMAAVKLGDEWGYIDESGAMVVAPEPWYQVGEFGDGLAPVKNINIQVRTEAAAITAYIDATGREVIPADPTWSDGSSYSEGLAAFYLLEGGVGYIDPDGTVVFEISDAVTAGPFNEGLAAVEEAPYRWGYVDRDGVFTIEPQFYRVTDFDGGVAVVEDLEGPLIVNSDGETVTRLWYEQVLGFSEGLAPALVWEGDWPVGEGSWGYINVTGELVIPAQFSYAYEFSGGLAQVWDEADKMAYIDSDGNYVWQEQ